LAHHKSAKKRIKTNEKARLRNRIIKKSIRTVTKKLIKTSNKEEATMLVKKLYGMLDTAKKKGVLHRNTVDRKKSKVARYLNNLSA